MSTLHSEKELHKVPLKWMIWVLVGIAVVGSTVLAVVPYVVKSEFNAHLLDKAKNYGELTASSLHFYPAPYNNESDVLPSFSIDSDHHGECIGLSPCYESLTTLDAEVSEGTAKPKHYYAVGEDGQWVDIFLCS
jgi:hypothetical protein